MAGAIKRAAARGRAGDGSHSPEVDAYIEQAPAYARPVLAHLRAVVHEAAPAVVEQMKWSRPFFVLQGPGGEVILGNMSAFKAHCSFGLWGAEIATQLRADGVASSEGMGSFGKIAGVADLPPKPRLLGYVREAARRIAEGERTKSIERPRPVRVARAEVPVPEALATALRRHKAASAQFAAMSPSCRKEYCMWVAEAKREDTRERRVTQAVEMIAEGKGRNWKYETAGRK